MADQELQNLKALRWINEGGAGEKGGEAGGDVYEPFPQANTCGGIVAGAENSTGVDYFNASAPCGINSRQLTDMVKMSTVWVSDARFHKA